MSRRGSHFTTSSTKIPKATDRTGGTAAQSTAAQSAAAQSAAAQSAAAQSTTAQSAQPDLRVVPTTPATWLTPERVPHLPFTSIRDIMLYSLSHYRDSRNQPIMMGPIFRGSSLDGQRSIADLFHILDYLIEVGNADDYKLQHLDDESLLPVGSAIERSSEGNFVAGSYLMEPTVESGKITFKLIHTFFDFPLARSDSPSKPVAKRAKHGDGSSTVETSSSMRDQSDHLQGFKMRLVFRDRGCVVCLAGRTQRAYKNSDDSGLFEGAHIIGVACHELWDTRGYSALITDPFTDPVNAYDLNASPTTRSGKDLRRINSLENGMLLCLQHHADYNAFRFAIHPITHKIFSFHSVTVELQGVEVKAPWNCQNVRYPPPHQDFLEMHYFTSISRSMKGSADNSELIDDNNDDYEELSEPEEVQNKKVEVWLHSSKGIMSSMDFTVEDKDNSDRRP